ncbi:MAG: hypothetical protein LC624_00895, partial [Halobacteriales archaeon]|nr:hypothetical protein [Halobacteriales archaeon]
MRAAVLTLCALLLSGCVSTPPAAPPGPGGPPLAASGWHLDCMLGSYERANASASGNGTWRQDCIA